MGAELGFGLVKLGLGGFEGVVAALQLGSTDKTLLVQINVALVIGTQLVTVGAGGSHGRVGRVAAQQQILWVELSQHLTWLDFIAQVDLASK